MSGTGRWWLGFTGALVLPFAIASVCSGLLAGQPVVRVVYAVAKGVQFAFPLLWVRLVEGRPIRLARPRASGMMLALTVGAAMLACILPAYALWFRAPLFAAGRTEIVRLKLAGYGITTSPRFALMAAYYVLAHSLDEEYYWRWFVYGLLRERLAAGAAIPLSALAFAGHHVLLGWLYAGDQWRFTAAFALVVTLGGALWAWLYERSGQLYAPWLSHAIVEISLVVIGYDLWR